MSFGKETKPETKDKPYQYEVRPKQDKSDVARKVGKKAVEGASQDKSKK